jgi:NAD(P)-dependent dehydrogenase (short-subunit alcohol dehydrogenase family)
MLVTSKGKATTTKELIEASIGVLIEALEAGRSEVLTAYLSTMANFHYYSFGNVLLIAMQKPGATRVAGIHAWNQLGRRVKRGEKGIMILAPMVGRKRNTREEQSESDAEQADAKSTNGTKSNGQLIGFRPVYVWDVLQTEGWRPFGSPINASKSAFGTFSDTLRLELHPFGISVCTVEPGAIKTPAVDKTLGDVAAAIDKLPLLGADQYGAMLKEFARRAYEREMNGSSPDVVAEAVHHALTSRNPRPRYRVGKHAWLLTALPRILSDRLLDAILLRITGLPTKFGIICSAGEC